MASNVKLTKAQRDTLLRAFYADYLVDGRWFFVSVIRSHPSTVAFLYRAGLLDRRSNTSSTGNMYALNPAGLEALREVEGR
jgi:hypothetical protein